ncbi:MAG: hypothetical protein S4CHLAM20_09300 [Chlamydiia bacterium]|nr:hypothetical protein [Chlamydiia bacterium]
MDKIIVDIHTDLKSLLRDWDQVCSDNALTEKAEFIEKVKEHILLLDRHSEELKEHKTLHDLIYHILHTPAGAPMVFKESLLECAQKESNVLHDYLIKSLNSSDQKTNFLFNSLSILNDQLQKLD